MAASCASTPRSSSRRTTPPPATTRSSGSSRVAEAGRAFSLTTEERFPEGSGTRAGPTEGAGASPPPGRTCTGPAVRDEMAEPILRGFPNAKEANWAQPDPPRTHVPGALGRSGVAIDRILPVRISKPKAVYGSPDPPRRGPDPAEFPGSGRGVATPRIPCQSAARVFHYRVARRPGTPPGTPGARGPAREIDHGTRE